MSFVCLVEIHLHFPENGSLKGKRKELVSLKAQLQRRFGASVSETAYHDRWQRATLTAALVGGNARLVRDGTIIYTGRIASLRRFQDDVREVQSGFECGVVLENYADVKEDDVIEVFETRQVERELE